MTDSVYTPDHPAVIASLEAMSYGRKSWEAARDECYAWLRVVDNLDQDANSNVGRRTIAWRRQRAAGRRREYHYYEIRLCGPWGTKHAKVHAPPTLQEARVSPLLDKAVVKRDEIQARLVQEYGEPRRSTTGLGDALRSVLRATPEGRDYLARTKSLHTIWTKVTTARAYAPEQWNPANGLVVHSSFCAQPDRAELIQRIWTADAARTEIKRRTAAKRIDPEARDPFKLPEGGISVGRKQPVSYSANTARTYLHHLDEQLGGREPEDEETLDSLREMGFKAFTTLNHAGLLWKYLDEWQAEQRNDYKLKAVA